MNNLDQKVLSCELSKKLVEKGIVLDTEFYWVDTRKSWKAHNQNEKGVFVPFEGLVVGDYELELVQKTDHYPNEGYNDSKPLPAPLLVEMLDVLPVYILVKQVHTLEEKQYWLQFEKAEYGYIASYTSRGHHIGLFTGKNLNESAFQTLLHLLENGHITLEDINK